MIRFGLKPVVQSCRFFLRWWCVNWLFSAWAFAVGFMLGLSPTGSSHFWSVQRERLSLVLTTLWLPTSPLFPPFFKQYSLSSSWRTVATLQNILFFYISIFNKAILAPSNDDRKFPFLQTLTSSKRHVSSRAAKLTNLLWNVESGAWCCVYVLGVSVFACA